MFFLQNTRRPAEIGSVLVIALVVLAILGALGVASLDVADMNILISANDRDSKDAFFHADSGANIAHEYLEETISDNATYFYGTNASWIDQQQFNTADYPLNFLPSGAQETYARFGLIDRENIGVATMASGYEGLGKKPTIKAIFLIRSHREGQRNSIAEVDIGWINVR